MTAPQPLANDQLAAAGRPVETPTTIRVSVGLLETLMTTVSELVLTRNQLLQILRHQKDSEFQAPLQRLGHVTSELQEAVMRTRMQPVSNAWGQLPRLVRDLSLELGKKIDLQLIGGDTDLDRQVLEWIKDPLMHMVRNAADHGIESPAERAAAGKPEAGRIAITAYHEGGHIVIEMADDGRGLDTAAIGAKAVARGLVAEADLAGMTEQQIQMFIFKPGFSTATRVTAVSGRGVGMDVVRTNIEKIGGSIGLRSQPGRGMKATITIPLTLAIVSALIVESCGERFALPQAAVTELVRAGAGADQRIERINGSPVLRLREHLLPLISLERLLGLDRDTATGSTEALIVVMTAGPHSFGVMVDRVFDTEEIVVKPLARTIDGTDLYSGNTILGDGGVIMILDPNGLAAATGGDSGETTHAALSDVAASDPDRISMLLVRAGPGGPKAVPLELVARLEEFEASTIERSGGRLAVQYRDRLMPITLVDPAQSLATEGRQPVLVFTDGDQAMGLAVDAILDIVHERLSIELGATRKGSLGSAIVAGRSTELLDVGHYLQQASAGWFTRTTPIVHKEAA